MIDEMRSYVERLFPLNRSLTGEPNRETLRILREVVPLTMVEYPSGMQLYDEWVVPDEWRFSRDAPPGKQILDGSGRLNLYSYLGEYFPGSMTVGEYRIKGRYPQEYLVSTYICHPSLANDNVSGMVLTAFLARELSKHDLNYSWRFVWCPETIGAIAYLFNNEEAMKRIDAGLVVTCVAGPNQVSYKRSFNEEHRVNGIIERVLCKTHPDCIAYLFDRHGSDERQYSSQGFRINCASIHSDKYYEYPEYHTSADNLEFISYERLAEMLDVHVEVALEMDADLMYTNLQPHGEPKLGERGLYEGTDMEMVLALLFECDGTVPLSSIATEMGVSVRELHRVADKMTGMGLLEEDCVG